MATEMQASRGRAAQRRRTRQAIVEAAMRLVAAGSTPTITDVASAADVSRRTVYMYFPSLEHLLVDATLGVLSQGEVDAAIDAADATDDPARRLEALVRSVQSMSPEVERLGRSLIRLTVEGDGPEQAGDDPRRGYRRVEWIETALDPIRDQVPADRFDRLVQSLAMVIGWEALIVQRDICGLSPQQGEELSVWVALTLLDATLAEPS
jgi:AcrR family transcriptional regulator